jgi:hypothetical protein
MNGRAKFRGSDRPRLGTPIAEHHGMDFTQYPMGLLGGLVALFVFGVFMGTWWWYGMRAMAART